MALPPIERSRQFVEVRTGTWPFSRTELIIPYFTESFVNDNREGNLAAWLQRRENNPVSVVDNAGFINARTNVTRPRDALSVARIIDRRTPVIRPFPDNHRHLFLWEEALFGWASRLRASENEGNDDESRAVYPFFVDSSNIRLYNRLPTPNEIRVAAEKHAGVTTDWFVTEYNRLFREENPEMDFEEIPTSAWADLVQNLLTPPPRTPGALPPQPLAGMALPDGSIFISENAMLVQNNPQETDLLRLALIIHEIHHQRQYQEALQTVGIEGPKGVKEVFQQLIREAIYYGFGREVYTSYDENGRWFLEYETTQLEIAAEGILRNRIVGSV